MSSVFAQVWFWALLAFLVGALLTWVLLVRPDPRRAETEERPASRPVSRPQARDDDDDRRTVPSAGGAVWPAEPATIPDEEAQANRPRARWLERDSLQGLSTQVGRVEETPQDLPARADQTRRFSAPTGYGQDSGVTAEGLAAPQAPAPTPEAAPQQFTPQQFSPQPVERREPGARAADFGRLGGTETPECAPVEEPRPPYDLGAPARAPFTEQPADEPAPAAEETHAGSLDTDQEFGEQASVAAEPEAPAGPILPKRQRGATNRIRGGFEPPRPIQPSVRPVARRTPQDPSVGTGGSLFEPAGSASADQAGQQQAPARPSGAHGDVPAGPFGPGSAMPLPGGGRPGSGFSVKASVTALRYCTEDSPQFPRMVAEVWFASAADAERVGFRPLT